MIRSNGEAHSFVIDEFSNPGSRAFLRATPVGVHFEVAGRDTIGDNHLIFSIGNDDWREISSASVDLAEGVKNKAANDEHGELRQASLLLAELSRSVGTSIISNVTQEQDLFAPRWDLLNEADIVMGTVRRTRERVDLRIEQRRRDLTFTPDSFTELTALVGASTGQTK